MDKRPERRQLSRPVRITLLVFLVIIACTLLAIQLIRVSSSRLVTEYKYDYRAYWAAARLLITQGNPYDRAQLLAIEQANGFIQTSPLIVWNPPWALVLILPFAFIPFPISTIIWSTINVLLILTCGAVLWHVLATPDDRRYWLGLIMVIAYMPTIQSVILGQISPWLLVSITGFLVAVKYNRDGLAGAALTLQLIKPHVAFLLLVAVVWWVLRERRWKVLLGALAALGAACAVVAFISPAVFGQYLRAESGLPLDWRSATLGTWLRSVLGWEQFWIQFMPLVIGLILVASWALRSRGGWDWFSLVPGLLLISVICAAYGWCCDQVVLLPVVVVLLTKLRFLSSRQRVVLMSLYVLTQVGMLLLNQFGIDTSYYFWYPLALAGLYAWQQAMIRLIPHHGANEVTELG